MRGMGWRWTRGAAALAVGSVLFLAGCAGTMMDGDKGMMKKDDSMMKKEGSMMKEDKGTMEKKQ